MEATVTDLPDLDDQRVVGMFEAFHQSLKHDHHVTPRAVLSFDFTPNTHGNQIYRDAYHRTAEVLHLWDEHHNWGLEVFYHKNFTILRAYNGQNYFNWREVPPIVKKAFVAHCEHPESFLRVKSDPNPTQYTLAQDIVRYLDRHQLLKPLGGNEDCLTQRLAEMIDNHQKKESTHG